MSACPLCEMEVPEGKGALLTVSDGSVQAFCADASGCRRRALVRFEKIRCPATVGPVENPGVHCELLNGHVGLHWAGAVTW